MVESAEFAGTQVPKLTLSTWALRCPTQPHWHHMQQWYRSLSQMWIYYKILRDILTLNVLNTYMSELTRLIIPCCYFKASRTTLWVCMFTKHKTQRRDTNLWSLFLGYLLNHQYQKLFWALLWLSIQILASRMLAEWSQYPQKWDVNLSAQNLT